MRLTRRRRFDWRGAGGGGKRVSKESRWRVGFADFRELFHSRLVNTVWLGTQYQWNAATFCSVFGADLSLEL